MLWQAVALGRVGSTVNALADVAHFALHWQEEGHHHHEDGSYHPDDSPESLQHVVGDPLGSSVALFLWASHEFPPQASAPPRAVHPFPVPDPDPDALLRPPRSRC